MSVIWDAEYADTGTLRLDNLRRSGDWGGERNPEELEPAEN